MPPSLPRHVPPPDTRPSRDRLCVDELKFERKTRALAFDFDLPVHWRGPSYASRRESEIAVWGETCWVARQSGLAKAHAGSRVRPSSLRERGRRVPLNIVGGI